MRQVSIGGGKERVFHPHYGESMAVDDVKLLTTCVHQWGSRPWPLISET